MEFETFCDQNGVDHVAVFLNEIDAQTNAEILEKLKHYKKLTFAQLMRAELIKKLEGKLFEVRVSVRSGRYRFLGTAKGNVFFMVQAAKKQKDQLPRSVINSAQNRISSLI